MIEKPTKTEIDQIEEIQLSYRKVKTFFHCKSCIEQFLISPLHEVMTPKEYGLYEVGSYEFPYPDGTKADITVVWCKRCGQKVWDGRSLTKIY